MKHDVSKTNANVLPPMSSGDNEATHTMLQTGMMLPPTQPGPLGVVGRFSIGRLLGAGGMGQVLLAEDPNDGMRVAIKMIRPEFAREPWVVRRFLTEARHMHKMSHPNVLRVFEVADRPEGPYYVMPYVAGGSLADRLRSGQPLPREEILRIGKQVAEALGYAHSLGIIHRDLKPANVLMDRDDRAYLTDFGLLRTVFNDSMVDVSKPAIEGTAPYLSPNAAAGKAEDTRCDIYAFGALLYELLTGRKPFEGTTPSIVVNKILAGPPEPIRTLNTAASEDLVKIAEWAMARELRDRYAEMADIVRDLDRVERGEPPLGPHGKRPLTAWTAVDRWSRWIARIAFALGVVVNFGVAWSAWRYRDMQTILFTTAMGVTFAFTALLIILNPRQRFANRSEACQRRMAIGATMAVLASCTVAVAIGLWPRHDRPPTNLSAQTKKASEETTRRRGDEDFQKHSRNQSLDKKTANTMSDDELLTMVQEATFRYFYDGGHPESGLIRDRYPFTNSSSNRCAIGGTGMGLMAFVIGVERGFVSREAAAARILKIFNFLETKCTNYYGAWSHWVNGKTGEIIKDCDNDGCDIVETACLMEGVLTVHQYFNRTNDMENAIRQMAKHFWEGVDWRWFLRPESPQKTLSWGWGPICGWDPYGPDKDANYVTGYDNTMIAYLLAMASPTYGISNSYYVSGWINSEGKANPGVYLTTNSFHGYKQYIAFWRHEANIGMPLFFNHFSFLGFDPRTINDGILETNTTYYDVCRNMTLIDHEYCKANPNHHAGYGDLTWGLTASDDPAGYAAHCPMVDNGTITPSASIGSIVYTPELSIRTIRYLYDTYSNKLWGIYGFKDALNLDRNWFANSYIAIDQGPILIMIENYRTKLIWKLFMSHPDIKNLLNKLEANGWTITDVSYEPTGF